MRTKRILFVLFILLITLFSTPIVSAHSGRTDSNGGHYDTSTGEYHYHHGYPAHQHPNGKCPYEYDDKTDHSSNNSSIDYTDDSSYESRTFRNIVIFFLVGAGVVAFFLVGGYLYRKFDQSTKTDHYNIGGSISNNIDNKVDKIENDSSTSKPYEEIDADDYNNDGCYDDYFNEDREDETK